MVKKFAIACMAAVGLVAASAANAATVSFRVQNSTTAIATNTYLNTCAAPNPGLQPVAAGGTSPVSGVNCGNSSAVAFDYTSGSKVCRFNLTSLYTPPNPLTGAAGYWTPSGTGTSRAGSARCTVTVTSFNSNTGDYTWTTRIQ